MLLNGSKLNLVQISRWMGHSKPSYTLDTYCHLMEGNLGDASFWDQQQTV